MVLNILFSIRTSLNLISDTVTRNKKQAAVIINNGIRILTSMLGAESFEIEAGWCKVFHQSTENLIIGILIKPIIARAADIFEASSLFDIACQRKI